MSGEAMTPGTPARPRGPWPRPGAGITATAHGLAFCGLALAGAGLLLAPVAAVAITALGFGLLLGPSRYQTFGLWLGLAIAVTFAGLGLSRVLRPGTRLAAREPATPARRLAVVVAVTGLGLALLSPRNGPDAELRMVVVLAVTLAGLGLSRFPVPALLLAMRRLATVTRRLAGQWCGVPIASPYQPPPAAGPGEVTARGPAWWLMADPATRRDLLWVTVNACTGWVLAAVPAALAGVGLIAFIGPTLGPPVAIPPPAFPGNSTPVLVALGLALIGLGLWTAPWLLRVYGGFARSMLAPSGQAELALRVRHLAQTRSETIDSGAAEMRRIERDLHDGAQARLVAMGMTLDAAAQVLDASPAAARALLAEARDASAKALAELRDLVRGICPPVLADRGLADAVRALALDTPLRVHLASELPGRPPAPVEAAAYFAVSELLANVSKHADAGQAWIDIRHAGRMLRIGVTDDGRGGADPARGSGLRGVERRLAAFDGVLALSSPPGGPTAVTMEIPCALSLPKTSSC
jgi:signal transduction histidine kinase